jgi:hypothetical protein
MLLEDGGSAAGHTATPGLGAQYAQCGMHGGGRSLARPAQNSEDALVKPFDYTGPADVCRNVCPIGRFDFPHRAPRAVPGRGGFSICAAAARLTGA